MRAYGIVALIALLVGPRAEAQAPERQGLGLFLLGGGSATFQHLNGSGTASLAGGPLIGAGVDWAPDDVSGLDLSGSVAWTRHELRGSRPGAGTRIDLLLVGGDVGYIFLNRERFSSAFFGGGGVMFIRDGATGDTRLEGYSRLMFDGHYRLSTRVSLLLQVAGLVYTVRNFPSSSVLAGYDHHQGDATFAAGVTLHP